jgi:hypothetical protein
MTRGTGALTRTVLSERLSLALVAATFKWFLSRITTTRGGGYEPVHHSAGIERLVLAARERRVVVATLVFFEFLAADKRRTIRDRRRSGARRPQ